MIPLYFLGIALQTLGRVVVTHAARRVISKQVIRQSAQKTSKWLVKHHKKVISVYTITQGVYQVQQFLKEIVEDLNEYSLFHSQHLRKTKSSNWSSGKQPQYREYYKTPIPYRDIINKVLCFANSSPIPGKKKKVTKGFRELRQLAATVMFDAVDFYLEWKSPLKSDMMFRNSKPLLEQGVNYKPRRVKYETTGTVSYKLKFTDTISPDITIVKHRKRKPVLRNIAAVVEVKFEGDNFNREQERGYKNEFGRIPICVIRVPHDCDCDKKKNKGTRKRKRTVFT